MVVGGESQLRTACLERPHERDFGAADNPDRDSFAIDRLLEVLATVAKLAYVHEREVGAQMRRRDQRLRARLRCRPRHGERASEVRRPVIDAGQHVAVDVDESADAPIVPVRCQRCPVRRV